MQDFPKIVKSRLQEQKPATHPDADLLTAFSEQLLTVPERLSVMEHIACCADCREVVALALPEPEETGLAHHRATTTKGWLTWPVLRWAIAAAGVLLITSAGILQYRRHEERVLQARNVIPAAPVIPQQSAPGNSDKLAAAPRTGPGKQSAAYKKGLGLNHNEAAKPLQSASPIPAVPGAPSMEGLDSKSGAYNSRYGVSAQQSGSRKTFQAPAVSSPSGDAANFAQTEVVGKAKAPPKEAFAVGLARAPDLRADPGLMKGHSLVRWAISASGALQRSLDGGGSWEDVNVTNGTSTQLHPANNTTTAGVSGEAPAVTSEVVANSEPPIAAKAAPAPVASQPLIFRAVSVSSDANEVWAGGSGAALYHTVDAGNSWLPVLPSDGGAVLTGDVISIQFPDIQSGTVSTSNGETWITFDGGKTWRKQP
jgi:hypothetical protein